jgi:hypothetical protein
MKRALPLVLLIPAVACASAQAKSPAERPNLEVPAPPPRVIEAMPSEPPLPEPVGELPAASATPRPRTTPPPASREAPKPDPKPEAAPVDQAPVAVVSPPAPATVMPQLRKPGAPDGAEASRQVRDVIDRAKKTLGTIDYQRLSTERRDQYDSANLLITQSEDAIKTLKFDIARNLADKADRIAKELQTR